MNKLEKLIGAKVNYVRFSHQVDISFIGGEGRNNKYANLQIETPFELKAKIETFIIEPHKVSTLAPLIQLLHTAVTNIELTENYQLSLEFNNGHMLYVKPAQKHEAWNVTGDDLPYLVAAGI